MRHYVFGYGSLLDLLPFPPARAPRPEGFVADLRGYRRRWNVAMDNSRDLPGYKYYLDPDTGERPDAFVTFLNLEPDAGGGSVNGVLFPVDEEALVGFDSRERNYSRLEVTSRIEAQTNGPIWTYVGSQDARARYEQGKAAGTAVVSRAYADLVRDGYAALGADELAKFEDSTDPPAAPLRTLKRVDLPGSAARVAISPPRA
jgi:cation transport regulator ChaC